MHHPLLMKKAIYYIPIFVTAFAQCPTGWEEFDNYCWYFSKTLQRDKKDTWTGAQSYCLTQGADLAIYNTVEQRVWIVFLICALSARFDDLSRLKMHSMTL